MDLSCLQRTLTTAFLLLPLSPFVQAAPAVKLTVTPHGDGAVAAPVQSAGHRVRILDDHSRGHPRRLAGVLDQVEMVEGDVRDFAAVRRATEGCEVVWHLAYVNGTRFFYERPDTVLEVGVKGTLNTIDAALDAADTQTKCLFRLPVRCRRRHLTPARSAARSSSRTRPMEAASTRGKCTVY